MNWQGCCALLRYLVAKIRGMGEGNLLTGFSPWPARSLPSRRQSGHQPNQQLDMTTLKFFYNGIKANGGKLQGAHYSTGRLIGHPEGTITIYARNYRRFTAEVHEVFEVQNDSDIMTDYFEGDRIRVAVDHPLYAAVLAAVKASEAHRAKMEAKREQRCAAQRSGIAA